MRNFRSKIKQSARALLTNDNFVSNAFLQSVSRRKSLVQRKLWSKIKKPQEGKLFNDNDLEIPGQGVEFGIGFENVKSLERMNSVAGYVPFKKSQTTIVLYNFFGKNYGLRKQLLGRICLLKKEVLVAVEWFLLPVDAVFQFDCSKLFKCDGDYLVLELFHPLLPKAHGGHDGHVRFWGVYGEHSSTVHSMPIPAIALRRPQAISARRYLPTTLSKSNSSFFVELVSYCGKEFLANEFICGDFSHATVNTLGYTSIDVENGIRENFRTTAVWHDAARMDTEHINGDTMQMIALPNVESIDAVLSFIEVVTQEETIKIHFFNSDNQLIKSCETRVSPTTEISLSDQFGCALEKLNFAVIEFLVDEESIISGYVNLFYVLDGKLCDSAHSHCVMDSRVLGEKKRHIKNNCGPQALKFMHFPPQQKFSSTISIWGGSEDLDLKLRFLMEDKSEYIVSLLLQKFIVNNIDLKVLFERNKIPVSMMGVIQVECFGANPPGFLLTFNRTNNTISVDHLTGG